MLRCITSWLFFIFRNWGAKGQLALDVNMKASPRWFWSGDVHQKWSALPASHPALENLRRLIPYVSLFWSQMSHISWVSSILCATYLESINVSVHCLNLYIMMFGVHATTPVESTFSHLYQWLLPYNLDLFNEKYLLRLTLSSKNFVMKFIIKLVSLFALFAVITLMNILALLLLVIYSLLEYLTNHSALICQSRMM